jgi:carbon-monoxide dehydrogenase catalytic subunit
MATARNTFLDKRLMEKAKNENVKLYYDRFEEQQPQCVFGLKGVCCRNCLAGPCRIIPGKQEQGICGATADVIAARNLLRYTASGASAHTDHAREVVLTLLKIAEGKTTSYRIKDKGKLRKLAKRLGKEHKGKTRDIAKTVALEGLEDFRRQEGLFHRSEGDYLNWLRMTATKERQETWKRLGILPVNADLESSHALHQTTMGNDADVNSLLLSCLRLGLVDGYAGLHLAQDMQDVLFGTPGIVRSTCNLGVLKHDHVNIAVHGHVPLLSEKIVEWGRKLEKKALKKGAKGVNVVGICCTGNEVLMRLGLPPAAHILQSELAIVTGALEAVVVDTQCIYPSLQDVAACYHTKIITTMLARMPGALHIPFQVETADEAAKKIVEVSIDNFRNRKKSGVFIPKTRTTLIGGFSAEAIAAALSKLDKKSPLRPLMESVKSGDIRGIVAVIGCRNPKLRGQKFAEELIKLLLRKDILILSTGCIAHSAAQDGLMLPEAMKHAGKGLRKVLAAIGEANSTELPPVLHMGSCVDNARIGTLVNALSEYTDIPIPKLPIAASAPEAMTEKAVAIAMWALALGISTHINPAPPVSGAAKVTKMLTKDLEKLGFGKVLLGDTPEKAAAVISQHIEKKRKNLA